MPIMMAPNPQNDGYIGYNSGYAAGPGTLYKTRNLYIFRSMNRGANSYNRPLVLLPIFNRAWA